MRKFPYPENCISLAPPNLNPLVISASSESVIRRDKRLSDIQAQISAAISAIGLAVTTFLKRRGERDVGAGAIQQLGEAGRLLTDLFYQETLSRRELAALNLSLKDNNFSSPGGITRRGMRATSGFASRRDKDRGPDTNSKI